MASPAFTDIATCKKWLAALPADPVKAYSSLAGETRNVMASALEPGVKLALYEALRPRLHQALDARAEGFRGEPVPFDEPARNALQDITGLWQALGDAYRGFIADMAGSAPDLAEHAALISQRAIRCYGLAMAECNRAYHAAPANLWLHMHETYSFAEAAGALTAEVEDPLGRSVPVTTIAGTYAHTALEQLAQPDALSVVQMDAVSRCLDRWESQPRLASARPAKSADGEAIAVDLARDEGPAVGGELTGESVRYFDMGDLGKHVRQTTASLKKQSPAELGLGNLTREAGERLLIMLHIQWCAAGTGRVDERKPVSTRVLVSPSIPSIHFHLTGKPFKAPGTEFSSSDRQRMDFMGESVAHPAGEASMRSSAIDSWEIINQSRSGFLGMSRPAPKATPVSHGQLIGLQTANKTTYIGIIQRLTVDREGGIWVGLRVLPGTPQAVSARIAGSKAAAPGKYDRALLLPEDAARKNPATLILMPEWFAAGRVLEIHPDRKFKLVALTEHGVNFERATFANP